ncbi:MAG: APC family permease [Terriglobales bacterium]
MSSNLIRTLNLRDLSLLTVGAVIGSGIFIVPAAVLQAVGGAAGPALVVWIVAGVLSMMGGLSYGELGAMRPEAGGIYVYIRECFGPLPAFLYGWALFFVIGSGTVATLAVAFSRYLGVFVPMTPMLARLVAVVVILIMTVINVRGTRGSADVQNWTTWIKVFSIVGLSCVLLALGHHGLAEPGAVLWPAAFTRSLASGFGLAMVSVLWAYEGWAYTSMSAGEAEDPQRTLPRAYLIGIGTLIGVYMLANIAYLVALGPLQAAHSPSIAAAAIGAVVGPRAAALVAVMAMISIYGAAHSTVLTAPRVYFAMARDGLFFKKLGEVHARFKTPAFAIIAGSAWSMVLAVSGTFEQLLTYVVFAAWIFYGLGAACVLVYRRREPEAVRPYRVPGYPWTPLLFIASAAVIVINTLIAKPANAGIGLGLVALGVPVFLFWQRGGRKRGRWAVGGGQ